MPAEYRILGQVKGVVSYPPGPSFQNLYTVPAGKQAVISSIIIGTSLDFLMQDGDVSNGYQNPTTNIPPSAALFGIAVRQASATLTGSQYIAMDNTFIVGGQPTILKMGLTLSATDVITVSCTNKWMTFHCFGSQITP